MYYSGAAQALSNACCVNHRPSAASGHSFMYAILITATTALQMVRAEVHAHAHPWWNRIEQACRVLTACAWGSRQLMPRISTYC